MVDLSTPRLGDALSADGAECRHGDAESKGDCRYGERRRNARWPLAHLTPRLLLAALLGVGLLVALIGYAGIEPVLRRVAHFQVSSLLLLAALMVLYEAVRAVQWIMLLRGLTPRPPWRTAAMAYLGGELVKGLPAGQYAQTILLRRAGGTPLTDSVAATSVLLWIEVAVCLLVIAFGGNMLWPWLRPVAWGLLIAVGAVGCALRGRAVKEVDTSETPRGRLGALRRWGDETLNSVRTLLTPGSLGPAAVCAALYVGIAGLVMSVLTHALGVQSIGAEQGIVIYAFALASNLIIVAPIDVGLIEAAGTAALVMTGAPRDAAVAIMLMHRAVCGVLTAGLTSAGLLVLRRQVRAAMHGEGHGADSTVR